jgi:phosphoribosylformylglycinamidine synthase
MQDTYDEELKKLLADWSICSKEWVIRQYDHEVQANSVVKPLVGAGQDGPGDAAVVAPILGSTRGLAIGCGLNPRYSDLDPYHMAASAIDEALRNVVAVGASLERCALLDNFCWGNTDQPGRLGGLVRAARACYDVATAYGVPFISGKDSLNNEFAAESGTIAIPGTLLVSALAVMPDVTKAVTMDAKVAGDHVYIVGVTRDELGASRYYAHHGAVGNRVPRVDTELGAKVFAGLSAATAAGRVRALHDCSEGGLAVALAEMAFAGHLGMEIDLGQVPTETRMEAPRILFSESNSRLLAEVAPEAVAGFEAALTKAGAPNACIGKLTPEGTLRLKREGAIVVESPIDALREAWQAPLRF